MRRWKPFPAFIEDRFSLKPLTDRDAKANNMLDVSTSPGRRNCIPGNT
jgi:hypothetical protein